MCVLDAIADLLQPNRQQTEHVPGALQLALVQHQAIYDAITNPIWVAPVTST